jgi:hypothetical protein
MRPDEPEGPSWDLRMLSLFLCASMVGSPQERREGLVVAGEPFPDF